MTPINILKKHYGYDFFRGAQEEIIDSILTKRDTLGIMPTGAGKSICFQVPALMFENVTLVISPLISLMNDQVTALRQLGIPAVALNSALSGNEMWQVLENTRLGLYKLIYVSPERLETETFTSFIQSIKIDMVTIDEAHCISQWGQDFRPSYLAIPEFISKLSNRPVVTAFTATATDNVKNDILNILRLNNPHTVTTGFDRENLYFSIEEAKPSVKCSVLISFLRQRLDESGIIYCSSRKNVETLTDILSQEGFKPTRYHAGLSDDERYKNQDDFLFDRASTMVATNAFGMGIDKSNVSYVVHFDMPRDVESYYQEVGRAGRDGRESHCLLLYSKQDTPRLRWLIDNRRKEIDPENIEEIEADKKLQNLEHKRLNSMEIFCTTNQCLRHTILRYFGENPSGRCDKCSNCNPVIQKISTDITEDCRKIISCIHRMEQRFGTRTVIDVLRGSKNAKIEKLNLNKLSTYGITNTSAKTLEEIVTYLIEEKYIYKEEGQFPILKLGVRYKELLKSDVKINAPIKVSEAKVKEPVIQLQKNKSELSDNELSLYGKLKDLCKELASREGVPSFYVFMDKTLIDMAQKSPTNSNDFLKVHGVGEAKLEKYGEDFINLISSVKSTPH